jgi:hypothetical protein
MKQKSLNYFKFTTCDIMHRNNSATQLCNKFAITLIKNANKCFKFYCNCDPSQKSMPGVATNIQRKTKQFHNSNTTTAIASTVIRSHM